MKLYTFRNPIIPSKGKNGFCFFAPKLQIIEKTRKRSY